MAPPTPPASASTSGKKKEKDKASSNAKKKVTPVQVAFLVERYLADNGFHAALAAFRSDAAHLFKPHHHKPAPKGLLPLADILHDYIALKESRVAIDSAMHAMHSLVSTYYTSNPPPAPPMRLPPLAGAQPASPPLVPPLFVASSSSPPQGTASYASPAVHHYAHTSTSVVVHNSSSDMSTPAPTALPTKKRKATKSAGKSTSASKKSCIAPATTSHAKGKAISQLSIDNQEQNVACAAQPTSAEHSVLPNLPTQSSSVAKSLFGPAQPQVHSSPSTPQKSHLMEGQLTAYQIERSSSVVANAHAQAQQDTSSSQCSIVSSKTLIVSPLKRGAYYAVERSYHVSSPLKSTVHKSSKREHVKGKLNFDTTDTRPGLNEQICDPMASTSSDGDKQDDFEIDFTNLDLFDSEFSFSELLLDLDLDTEGVHCQNTSTSAEVQRLEPVSKSDCMTMDPLLRDSVKTTTADPTEDITSQGVPSITSVRAITKRIKIVSPVKGRTAH
ncbi:hypothetical protein QOZ80_7AG0552600 [Eleusine coracana subsp. coracana]|nr:hypothetical protein QOZ80_7AG0552600 [Eleusine coracana subsp. coracana]